MCFKKITNNLSWETRTKKRFDFWKSLDSDEVRKNTVKELFYVMPSITKGLKLSITLLVISFIVGIGLLVFTAVLLFNENVETTIKILFGSAGLINTIGFLFFYPIEKIQLTKARLAVYQAVYATWISDLLIYESLITKYHEKGKLELPEYVKLRESTTKSITELMIIINPKSDLSSITNLIKTKEKTLEQ
jgi:hypothetical protein